MKIYVNINDLEMLAEIIAGLTKNNVVGTAKIVGKQWEIEVTGY